MEGRDHEQGVRQPVEKEKPKEMGSPPSLQETQVTVSPCCFSSRLCATL